MYSVLAWFSYHPNPVFPVWPDVSTTSIYKYDRTVEYNLYSMLSVLFLSLVVYPLQSCIPCAVGFSITSINTEDRTVEYSLYSMLSVL